jgi:hypothetical protein
MRHWLTIILILFSVGWSANAQVLSPLQQVPASVAVPTGKPIITPQPLGPGDTLSLPFFDDFAKGEGAPDPSRWADRGGVSITDRYASSPPTVFAASFDGLNAAGQSYGSANAVGPTDTLTSKPLNLAAAQPQDSVYLSFFWQAGGKMDAPNFSSSTQFYLQLQFKEANGNWTPIWTQKGTGRSTDFAAVMIALKESKYLYNGFQFRWVSGGSQNGLRDVWHLDYVYLDRNRRLNQLQTADVALTQRLPSLLQRYTAMPLWQFLVNPAGEVRPQVGSEMVNLSNSPAAISWRAFTRNLSTGAVDTFLRGSAPVNPGSRTTIAATPSKDFLSSQQQPYSLQTVLFLNTKEPNFYTRYNDTLRRQTDLLDYYAYDDGTAESGFSYPSSTAVQLAYQFDLSQQDRLKMVRIFFTATNTPGTELYLRVWANNNGKPADQPLYEQRFTVPATAGLNNWLDIVLDQQVPVSGRFYVGYRQPTGSIFVNVGYDLNESAPDKLFAMNGATAWDAVPNIDGALLIRPVMAGTLTASAEELTANQIRHYPNPVTENSFYLTQAFDQAQLYAVTGQLVQTWGKTPARQRLSLPDSFSPGIYFVKAFTGSQHITLKLILTK